MIKNNRWLIAITFAAILGVNQFLWLSFATIVSSTQEFFGVSAGLANLLTLMFPVVFVLLAIHSGHLLDQYGYKKIVSIAAILMLVGSTIRWAGTHNFWIVFFGQLLIAISQPYITNAINQITSDWFDKSLMATVTGVITAVMFLATALGAFVPAAFLESHSFSEMLLFGAIITATAVIPFLLCISEKGKEHHDSLSVKEIESLLHNKRLWFISFSGLFAIGFFNGLTNWISKILEPKGFDESASGAITAMLIIGGIIGALIIPVCSDILKKRHMFLVISSLAAAIISYPLLFSPHGYTLNMLLGFTLGFFFLAGYPILIAQAEHSVHSSQSAKAVSMLMLFGNLGGIIIVLAMEAVKGITSYWSSSVWVLIASGAMIGILVLLGVKDQKTAH